MSDSEEAFAKFVGEIIGALLSVTIAYWAWRLIAVDVFKAPPLGFWLIALGWWTVRILQRPGAKAA